MTISTQRLRFLRGNTAAASAFTGLQGELIFDTDLYTLRLQDGVTPGGYTLATSAQLANVAANVNYGNSNVGAYLTTYTGNLTAGNILSNNYLYPNGVSILTGVQSNYGNANVAAYLVANPQPGTYSNTNVAAYLVANPQSGTYSNTNVAAYLVANPQSGTYSNTNVAAYLTSLSNVKVGFSAGYTNQGFSAVAIGPVAAATNQGNYSVAIGSAAGQTNQGNNSVAIGTGAAAAYQGLDAIAIGTGAGGSFQGNGAVAIGSGAGGSGGSDIATVAIGDAATVDGNYSIAIGRLARVTSASTIMLNATGSVLNSSGSGFYVDPVSSGTAGNVLYYNTSTKKITYGPAAETYGNANVAAYLPTYTGNIAADNINFNGTSGGIVQTPNSDFSVLVQDDNNDDYAIYNRVGAAGTTLGETRLRRGDFQINFPNASKTFNFDDSGILGLPGDIALNTQGGDISLYAIDNGSTGSAEIKTISYAGATLGSNVRVTQSAATISTSNAAYTWTFDNAGNVTLPGSIHAQFITSPASKITGFEIDTTRVSVNGNVTAANFIGNIQGPSTVFGNLSVTGNLIVSGNTITVSTNNFVVSDNIIFMANNNPANILDIGFAAHYTTDALRHTGFVKDVTDGTWKLFSNVPQEITTTVDFTNAIYDPIRTGNITAPYFVGDGSQLTGISTYSNANVASYLPTYTGNIAANIVKNNKTWTFESNGTLTVPGDSSIRGTPGLYSLSLSQTSGCVYVSSTNTDYSRYSQISLAYESGVTIAASTGNLNSWSFAPTGNLTYPDGTKTSGNTVTLANSSAYYWHFNEPAGPVSDTITLSFNSLTTEQGLWYFGTDSTANTWILDSSVKSIGFSDSPGHTVGGRLTFGTLANLGNASANDIELSSVNANAYVRANQSLWKFDVHGALTLPASMGQVGRSSYTNGMDLYNNNSGVGYVRMNFDDQSFVWVDPAGAHIQSTGGTWDFSTNGNVIVPGSIIAAFVTSPAPVISGFDISTSQVTATGNITANGYFIGNGALLTGIVASGANYGNTNVATFLGSYGSNTIVTTGNVSAGYFIGNGALLTGIVASGSTYSNANVVSMLAANTSISLGNVVTVYPTASNITTLFIGNNTTITAGGSGNNASYMMNNLYFQANGQLMARNTYASGAGQFYIDGGTFNWAAASSATANTAAGLGARMSLSSTALATQNSIGITSAGTLTVQGSGGLVTTQTTFPLLNATATTINFGNAATTINMGSATSNVWVGNAIGNNTGTLTVRATGIYNTLTLSSIQGGYNSPPYTNQTLTGGSGTGMTANYSSVGGYISTITVTNPGSGYRNGDVLTVPGGLGSTVILSNYNANVSNGTTVGLANYTFGLDGNLALPGNVSATGSVVMSGGNISGVGNIVGISTNTTITANTFVTSFLSNGAITTTSNLISSASGLFSGPFNESSTSTGVFIGNTGTGTPSPRIGFFNGNTTQNWQIDNYGGSFRWFTPNVTRMSLDPVGNLTVTANLSVATDATISSNVTINGTGALYMPNRPAFRVFGQGGSVALNANLTSSNWTVDYSQGDISSFLSNASGVFTAPVAGLYSTSLTARTTSNINGSIIQAVIRQKKAGSTSIAVMIEWGTNTTFNHASTATTVKLAVGDQLWVACTADGGTGGFSFDGNDHWDVVYIG